MIQRICPECDLKTDKEICPRCSIGTIIDKDRLEKHDPLIGRILNKKFRIDELIGKGGMGSVYRATNITLNQKVAIKILHKTLVESTEQVKRFYREGRMASLLEHPNTIKIFDFGETPDGLLYIVMEFLSGKSLSKIIKNEAPIKQERVVDISLSTAQALFEAHSKGVVHRDLKPENIMLIDYYGQKDFVKVLDFGIAKFIAGSGKDSYLTKTGGIIGSPYYMSPEQIKCISLDGRSDIYSLGIIMYEALTNRLPFTGNSALDIMMAHVNNEVPPFPTNLVINEDLKSLVFKMLSKNIDERPSSAEKLIEMLHGIKESFSVTRGARVDIQPMKDKEVETPHPIPYSEQMEEMDKSSDLEETYKFERGMSYLSNFFSESKKKKGIFISVSMIILIVFLGGYFIFKEPSSVTLNSTFKSTKKAEDIIEKVSPPPPPSLSKTSEKKIEQLRATIIFESQPKDAFVFEGETLIGKTPFEKEFAVDGKKRKIRFSLDKYKEKEIEFEVKEGETVRVSLDPKEILVKPKKEKKIDKKFIKKERRKKVEVKKIDF